MTESQLLELLFTESVLLRAQKNRTQQATEAQIDGTEPRSPIEPFIDEALREIISAKSVVLRRLAELTSG